MAKENRFIAWAFGFCFICICIPLATAVTMPLWDYPTHMARIHILALDGSDQAINNFYQIRWSFLPNLALEFFALPLARLVSADIACRIALALSFFFTASGVFLLSYSLHKKFMAWPLLVFVFLYNQVFLMGFISYLIGLGLWLWVTAAWICFRPYPVWFRMLLFSVLTTLLLVFHLYAFLLYGLTVACYELSQLLQAKPSLKAALHQVFVTGVQFVLPLVIFVSFSKTSSGVAQVAYGSFKDRLTAWAYLFALYDRKVHLALALSTFLLVWFLVIKRKIVMDWFASITMAVLALAFFAAPSESANSQFVIQRLPIACAFLFIALTQYQFEGIKGQKIFAAGICALVLAYTSHMTWRWSQFDTVYAELNKVMDGISVGSKVLNIYASREKTQEQALAPALLRAADFRVVDKKIFLPDMFANAWHQPIAFTPDVGKIAALLPFNQFDTSRLESLWANGLKSSINPFKPELLSHYDYLLVVNIDDFPPEIKVNLTQPILQQGRFSLFKL